MLAHSLWDFKNLIRFYWMFYFFIIGHRFKILNKYLLNSFFIFKFFNLRPINIKAISIKNHKICILKESQIFLIMIKFSFEEILRIVLLIKIFKLNRNSNYIIKIQTTFPFSSSNKTDVSVIAYCFEIFN